MNNTGILKKVIEELGKESPKLDYIRGMLETLYEMQGSSEVEQATYIRPVTGSTPVPATDDEAALLDAKARAAIGAVQAIAEASKTE